MNLARRLDPRQLVGQEPLRPLAVLFALNFFDEFDGVALAVLLPEIRHTFHLSLAGLGAIGLAVGPFGLLLDLPTGYFGDRWRRTRMAAVGMAVWAVFAGLTGLAPVLAVFVIARIGSDLGRHGEAVHGSLLSDWYPVEIRARVLYAYSLADPAAGLLAPVVVGVIAAVANWRVPFVLLVVPSLAVAWAAARLHEPPRGLQERRLAGAEADAIHTEEEPAGWGETFRTLYSFATARRVYLAIALLTAGVTGLSTLIGVYFDEVFHLGTAARGLLITLLTPSALVGLAFGGRIVQRRLGRDPGATLSLLSVVAAAGGVAVLGVAVAPNLVVAIAAVLVANALTTVYGPGLTAVASMIVPPRMRTLGFATASLWAFFGLLVLPIAGLIGDRYGVRAGIFVFGPVYALGGLCMAWAGRSAADDIARSLAMSRTRAEARRNRDNGDPRLLLVRGLRVAYDGVDVLGGVDLDLADGESLAVLGTNGSGKTTLLRAISALVAPSAGAIVFDGVELTGADATKTTRLGMVHAPGGRGVYPQLTVTETLRAATWTTRHDPDARDAAVESVLDRFPRLRDKLSVRAGELSGGEQQLLSLAQAMVTQPRLLIVDELSLGLSPAMVDEVVDAVLATQATGAAVIVVDQSIDVARRVASRAVFLERGEIVFDGAIRSLARRRDLIRPVFLPDTSPRRPRRRPARGKAPNQPVILEARGVTAHFGGVRAVDGVDLVVREGEVVGLVGPNGAGKTSLLDVLSGLAPMDSGQVILDGVDLTNQAAHARARLGLGRSFQDARRWPTLTVAESVAVAAERHVTEPSVLRAALGLPAVADSEAAVMARVDDTLERLGLRRYRHHYTSELSTGTRRLVELGCILVNDPRVVLLDEPTAGLARREAEALIALLRELVSRAGYGLVVVEHDLPLVSDLADRLVAMANGAVVADGPPATVLSDPEVVSAYLGVASS